MAENFRASLQVTVMGMALVILTLLIIAAIIMLLGRIFKPKPETEEARNTPADKPEAVPTVLSLATATTSLTDEAAAIALAITLQRACRKSPSMMPRVAFDEKVTGEVVNVVNIEPGAGIWAGTSRLQPTK